MQTFYFTDFLLYGLSTLQTFDFTDFLLWRLSTFLVQLLEDKPSSPYSSDIQIFVFGNVFSQPADEDVHAAPEEVIIFAPYLGKDILPGKHLVLVHNKIPEQLSLLECKLFPCVSADQL